MLALAFGSFTNVLIYRIPRELSILKPRSFCPKCKTPLPWYLNLPCISFLLLKAKCKFCSDKISLQYPIVELLLLFCSWTFINQCTQNFSWNNFIFYLFVVTLISMIIALAFIDQRFGILPHKLSYFAIVFVMLYYSIFGPVLAKVFVPKNFYENICWALQNFGLVFFVCDFFVHCLNKFVYGTMNLSPALVFRQGALVKYMTWIYSFYLLLMVFFLQKIWILLGLIYLIFEIIPGFQNLDTKISEQDSGMGGGDIVLIALIGLSLGYQKTIFVFLAAAYLFVIFALFYFFYDSFWQKKKINMQNFRSYLESKMPFGPALAISFLAAIMI